MYNKNVGLIGSGKWGKILETKLKKYSNLLFVANSKYKYLEKLKKVEWVFIATPDKTHFKIVNKCLDQKKSIFCEKPLTLSYHKSKFLFDKANKNRLKLFVDEIQIYYGKKIKLKKINHITRKKKGIGDPNNLLYRFAYHDFYFLYDKLRKKKIKKIQIIDCKKDLKFKIIYYDKSEFNFDYSLNNNSKIHKINNTNFVTKKDILSKMIKNVLNEKINYNKNRERSLFANKLIDNIKKKLK